MALFASNIDSGVTDRLSSSCSYAFFATKDTDPTHTVFPGHLQISRMMQRGHSGFRAVQV